MARSMVLPVGRESPEALTVLLQLGKAHDDAHFYSGIMDEIVRDACGEYKIH